MSRVIRVFPRRTRATPADPLAYVGGPELFTEADHVEISVTFTWDRAAAERLAGEWRRIAPVTIGGPAYNDPGGDFMPGKYLRPGYVITSRGCPCRCTFCFVPRREGPLRELPIRDGWNVLDNNLLACSEGHIRAVFAMLASQKHRAEFTGGLEAARLQDWHVDSLAGLTPRPRIFFAYDSPEDWEPLVVAAGKVQAAGFTPASHAVRCYVLIGGRGDTLDAADARLRAVARLGLFPMAMLWRPPDNSLPAVEWRRFQRGWAAPQAIGARISQ